MSHRFLLRIKHVTLVRKYTKLSYLHNVGEDPLKPITMGQLLEDCSFNFGSRPAVISRHQNKKMTFKDVLNEADRLAAGFHRLGYSRGDGIGLLSPNVIEWYVAAMACARGGYLLVPINPAYQSKELEYCINKTKIKGLIMADVFKTQNYYELLTAICQELPQSKPGEINSTNLPFLKNVIVLSEDKLSGCHKYSDIMNMANEENKDVIRNLQTQIQIDDPFCVQFTSGTTGKPKIVMNSHFCVANNGYYCGKRSELSTKHHIGCLQNPFFHAYAIVIGMSAGLSYGTTLVLPSAGYDPQKNLDAVKEENCTILYGTPTMFIDLVKQQKERNEDISPDVAITGGASCPPQLFHDMKKILNCKKVKSVYGLSETTAVVFQSLPDDNEYEITSTVGYLQEHLEIKVVDKDNNIVPRGVAGELCIRGYSNMLEYMGDPEKTEEIMDRSRWLRTGDQFIIDEKGYAKVVGRLKEMIIRGGENIFPKEIEDFLQTHPNILEVQVIGIPHERLGEEVCACVRLREKDSNFTLEHIKAFCKGNISHFKIPSILKIRESFPKTASGKVEKYKLLEEILKEL